MTTVNNMQGLSNTLKTILNALAMQNAGDYLSDEDKQANLSRVLAEIEREKYTEAKAAPAEDILPADIALQAR